MAEAAPPLGEPQAPAAHNALADLLGAAVVTVIEGPVDAPQTAEPPMMQYEPPAALAPVEDARSLVLDLDLDFDDEPPAKKAPARVPPRAHGRAPARKKKPPPPPPPPEVLLVTSY